MTRRSKPRDFEYNGQRVTIRQPGWYCTRCNEGVHDGADIRATDKIFMAFKARVDGVLSPDDVRRARERLRLSQRRAGQLLGGGPRAFQKYESGTAAVSQPMSNLLRLLAKDPKRLTELHSSRPSKRGRIRRTG
jgi:HTH-type transcriptional regulator/antitoxin MqsA